MSYSFRRQHIRPVQTNDYQAPESPINAPANSVRRVHPVVEFFFPRTLGRLNYFIRAVLGNLLSFQLLAEMESANRQFYWVTLITCGIVVIYTICFVLIPRIRACGLAVWTGLLALIPGIGQLYCLSLLFKSSEDPIKLAFSSRPEEVFISSDPTGGSIVGSRCYKCDQRILMIDDGLRTPTGQVICHACWEKESQEEPNASPVA